MVKLCVLSILLSISLSNVSGQIVHTKVEMDVFRLQRQWLDAYQKFDTATLSSIEAEDFIRIDGDGTIFNKEQDIKKAETAKLKISDYSLDVTESRIRVFGNGAVINGKLWTRYRNQNQIITQAFAYTNTFVKQKGRWQIVLSQMTRLPSEYDMPHSK